MKLERSPRLLICQGLKVPMLALSPSAEGVGNEAGKPGADGESVLMTLSGRAWMTKREVAAATGFSATKAARLLRELVDDGLVEAEGATKARVYRRI